MVPITQVPARHPRDGDRVAQLARRRSAVHPSQRRDHRDGGADRAVRWRCSSLRSLTRTQGRPHAGGAAGGAGLERRLEAHRARPPRRAAAVPRRRAVLRHRARRSVFVADARGGQLPGPPHRGDDRCLVEHDGALPGGGASTPRRRTRRRSSPTVAAAEAFIRQRMNGKYHDLIGAGRVRRRSLRRHAVHDRLREHPAEPVAHRRLDRVHEVPRSGHDDLARRSSRAPACSRRSTSSTPPAT